MATPTGRPPDRRSGREVHPFAPSTMTRPVPWWDLMRGGSAVPIIGTHVLLYTAEPEPVRTIMRDVLELDHTAFLR